MSDADINGLEFVLDIIAGEDGYPEFLTYQFDPSSLADMEELDPISNFIDADENSHIFLNSNKVIRC